jgi:serine protease Do
MTGVLLGGAAVYLGARPPAAVPATPVVEAAPTTPAVVAPSVPPPVPTLADAVARTMNSVVNLESSQGLGAGIIVDPSGIVLTNYHVLAEALRPPPTLFGARLGAVPELTARFADDRRVGASVLIADPEEDLAIVRLEAADGAEFQAAALGRSADLVVGQDVFAIGNPLGLRNTVSRGIVSAVDRTGILSDPQRAVLQLDASINVGNSGGPLFNMHGELVGIVVARPEQAQGIAFALPMDHVRGFLEALTTPEGARSGVIGVTLASADMAFEDTQALALGYRAGLVVGAVQPRGPAEAAGMKTGDVIVELRGKRLDGLEDTRRASLAAHLQKTVRGMFEGEVLSVTVVRGESATALSVEVGAASARDQVGIDAEEQLGLRLRPDADAPTVAQVLPGTRLWGDPEALVGSRIRSVMGAGIDSYDDLAARLVEVRRLRQHRGSAPRVLLGVESAEGTASAALLQLP